MKKTNLFYASLWLLLTSLVATVTAEEAAHGEAEVRIFERNDQVVVEYRRNGQLFMAKINPSVGPAYYLVDKNGDGILEAEQHPFSSGLLVPQWVLLTW